MGKGVNKVTLIGNVGTDPDVRDVNGDKVVNFSLATPENYKNDAGEWAERPEWHRIVAWKHHAELIDKYVNKGDRLYIEGRLKTRDYDKDGVTVYTTEIIVREMAFLGKPKGNSQTKEKPKDTVKKAGPINAPQPDEATDDLPF